MPSDNSPQFIHGENGLTRFPPNVEQIRVVHEANCSWLIARRNDVELKFPLSHEDCQKLASLLKNESSYDTFEGNIEDWCCA
jgi:hypothetical protein